MAKGRSVDRVVTVSLTLSRIAAGYQNFGATLLLGNETFLDIGEGIRSYADLSGVLADTGTASPLGQAASLFFAQSPQPTLLYLGRWAQTPTNGVLRGAILTPGQQLLSGFTAITAGSLHLTVDGTGVDVTGINLSGALNLNGVANVIQTAIQAARPGVTLTWDGVQKRFVLTSPTSGPTSSMSYVTPAATGTALGPLLHLTATPATGSSAPEATPVVGVAAETLAAAVARIADRSSEWYALVVATATPPSTTDHLLAAGIIEGLPRRRVYGLTTQDPACLDPSRSDDIGSVLMAAGYQRTFVQYSSWSPYAVASFIGRAATVNFSGNNTAITLKFKAEPGIVAEVLPESQYAALQAKNINCYTQYQNGVAIIEQGVMAGGYFFDEIQGTDWYQNYLQTNLFNALQQPTTKVPQTDAGMNMLRTVMDRSAQQAVTNGLVASGVWNLPGFGQLEQGQRLDLGYYTYAPPIDLQPQADRERRVSVAFQQALKLAGAVHFVGLAVTVNR